jgi:hypothetical protein
MAVFCGKVIYPNPLSKGLGVGNVKSILIAVDF